METIKEVINKIHNKNSLGFIMRDASLIISIVDSEGKETLYPIGGEHMAQIIATCAKVQQNYMTLLESKGLLTKEEKADFPQIKKKGGKAHPQNNTSLF